ncbi:tRNA (guanosine(46)-N7)-methyltransferase TrmB [Candidatus Uabimicrobium amorphum]|uniref:tRNA (guanine-N(7)-)-methyltransferase n=1 Tax=Uabimicrobium amorphum TaxID=2596890 RepID=A0A5S9IKY5_UABAM|nr:tRNA (guanosine(46)-N7)-methyltransferase TrmB [Candidatus Uabimicrobium amorphum]BBM83783.1 tRNA (guanine-N(7)-)-methyltransferase [Candidatus Uabimicrobium amorphum]
MEEKKLRTVRSYVRRESRLTSAQQRALDEFMPQWGLTVPTTTFDFRSIYGNDNEVVLEIGFGPGTSLVEQAIAEPQTNFLGVEIHGPGVGSCLAGVAKNNLQNVRVMREDFMDVLPYIPDNSLQKIQIFFPDPWPKKRHHKRRLIQVEFVVDITYKLKSQGIIHLATDWENYAAHMVNVLNRIGNLQQFSTERFSRPKTKFEIRGEKLGHGVWDFLYRKTE